jgi:glucoside 3-dehydrogenase (cytochrome c) catalytic subunit
MPSAPNVDAVIVGSGATGGWVAKRLTEAGLRVVMLEAGRRASDADYREHVPASDLKYRGLTKRPLAAERPRQSQSYACDEWNAAFYASDLQEPYTTPPGKSFPWVGRIRMVGGRSNVWGRQSYRLSDLDFAAASRDGVGVDWPLGYADLAPYYDTVERYVGVSGQIEGYPWLPDGQFLPPMPMTCPERALRTRVGARLGRLVTIGRSANLTRPLHGRAVCHYCGPCEHGCITHSYFNSTFTTVADALATGRLTLVTDAMAHRVTLDRTTGRARGVEYIDRHTRAVREVAARAVVLCAQTFESTRILLNSASPGAPAGLGNSSGLLGRYLQVHFTDAGASADFPEFAGRPARGGAQRPNGIYVPRFRNLPDGPKAGFLRGYGYQGNASVPFRFHAPGYGAAYKQAIREAGAVVSLQGFGECLPNEANRVEIDPSAVDAWGIPVVRITIDYRENEQLMLRDMADAAAEMLEAAGGHNVRSHVSPRWASHEVGTARMGVDPKASVLTPFQQLHDVANAFVMDGSGFPSGGWTNPTLTMMALAVRSTDHLLERMKRGDL